MNNKKYLILYKRKYNNLGAELLQFATGSIIMKKELESRNLYFNPNLRKNWLLATHWHLKSLNL
jgi:hypothetical protein